MVPNVGKPLAANHRSIREPNGSKTERICNASRLSFFHMAEFSCYAIGHGVSICESPWVASRTLSESWKIELQDLSVPREYLVSADDCGSEQIFDAALLPNGRCLVALGECGMKLVTRGGTTIAHFDQPANRIVVSESGSRAIALARRGDSWHLSRVDLQSRKAGRWCEGEISQFAPGFDGSVWYLGAAQEQLHS
jgi:hypothetical protein